MDCPKETLESIGSDMGITRERVRQIESSALEKLREKGRKACQGVFSYFQSALKKSGGLKKEDLLLEELGAGKFKNHILFLLTLGESFERVPESDVFYALWTIEKTYLRRAERAINNFIAELKKKNQPRPRPAYLLPSYLEVSKIVLPAPGGQYGLREWPEVNPRRVKDKAYLTLKHSQEPLHFTQVASLMEWDCVETVHNELIKDDRFVLVGRGIYALREWGYEPGTVKEVIADIIRKFNQPLPKEKIVEKVLQQRRVQINTIMLNLQNKKYFVKKSKGYTIRKV